MDNKSKMLKAVLAEENIKNVINYEKEGVMRAAMSGFVDNDDKVHIFNVDCPSRDIKKLVNPDEYPQLSEVIKQCRVNYAKSAKPQKENGGHERM